MLAAQTTRSMGRQLARGFAHGKGMAAPRPRLCAVRVLSAAATEAGTGPSTSRPSWEIRMLYDGDCPLCLREVNFLMSKNTSNKIDFVDIAAPTYDPADNMGITFEEAMKRIHAITADGRIAHDVEAFRLLYEAVGLGWVYAATKNESVLKFANAVYGVWSKYRMEVTGREALSIILEKRRLMEAGRASCRDVGVEAASDGSAAACEVVAPAASASSSSSSKQ